MKTTPEDIGLATDAIAQALQAVVDGKPDKKLARDALKFRADELYYRFTKLAEKGTVQRQGVRKPYVPLPEPAPREKIEQAVKERKAKERKPSRVKAGKPEANGEHVAALVAAIASNPGSGKAALLKASKIPENAWRDTIVYLLDKAVRQEGTKRGAKYFPA